MGERPIRPRAGRGRARGTRRLRGVLRLSRCAAVFGLAPADRNRRGRRRRQPVPEGLGGDPHPGLQARHRCVGGSGATCRFTARVRGRNDASRTGASSLLRDARRLSGCRGSRAATGGRTAPPAPAGGRLRLRGSARRQFRGCRLRHPAQPGHHLRHDLRGLRLFVPPRRPRAPQRPCRCRLRRRQRGRRRHGAGACLRPEAAAPRPRRLSAVRPPRGAHRRRSPRVRDPPRALLRRGVAGAAPLGARRRRRPLPHTVLRQPEEVRDAADQHLPCAADRAGQVGVQVRLDPRHGRILWSEHLPRRIRAPPPGASTACWSPPATSRKPRRWPRVRSAPTMSSS